MSRVPSLLGACLLAAALGGCSGQDSGAVNDSWGDAQALSFPGAHLLLISVDTLRADRLGCYGYGRGTSPQLDKLAQESVLFETAYSHSPKTASSHMSLFTSLLPSVHKVRNWSARLGLERTSLPGNRLTLPQVLAQSGYATAAVTSAGNIQPEMGFSRGFGRDGFVGRMADVSWHIKQALQRWQDIRMGTAPGFVFLHTYQVHGPYLPPPEFMERFAPNPQGVVAERVAALAPLPFAQQWAAMNKGMGEIPPFWEGMESFGPAEAAYLSDLYDGEVAYTDERLGELLDSLRQMGLLDRMILVLLSDHGEEFFEHGSFEHDQLFREHLHVPLLVRLPGGRLGGTRVSGQAGLIDVMPTLLELLDLQGPPTMAGESLVPAMRSGRTSDRPVVAERVMFLPSEYSATLRSSRQAVTFFADMTESRGHLTGYDLVTDARELNDVFDQASFARPADALWNELARAFAALELLDAEDSGTLVRLTDTETLNDLAALGYTGDSAEGEVPTVSQGTPLDLWPLQH